MRIRLAFVFALLAAAPLHARVLDLHSEIRVEKSGELRVTERITVEARKGTPRLERELPREARVVELVRDGHAEGYALDGARLLAGAPNEGRHLYQVTYRAPRRIAFLGDHDALHWSLQGAERMTAEVILPAGVPAKQIRLEASGAEYQSLVRDGRAAFRSQAPLALIVRFPKGIVAEPGMGERARWFFSDYFGMSLLAALLALTAWTLWQIKSFSARNSGSGP
jgi:hypothetical protein